RICNYRRVCYHFRVRSEGRNWSVGMTSTFVDTAYSRFSDDRLRHWDGVAQGQGKGSIFVRGYHARMRQVFAHLVAPDQAVLEIGCGRGDVLAAVKPRYGVGVDFCPKMIEKAERAHPELRFVVSDAHELDLDE